MGQTRLEKEHLRKVTKALSRLPLALVVTDKGAQPRLW